MANNNTGIIKSGEQVKNRILIVEDDYNLRTTLHDNLEMEDYQVSSYALLEEARQFLSSHQVDLIILDLMLPDGDGFELCRWVRQKSDVLILMLTARNLEKDVVEGFISGADDYVSKPYRASELLLRIKALLKRKSRTLTINQADINGFIVNWSLREVRKDDQPIHLTKTAFDILAFLYQNLNQTSSRDQILNAVWGSNVYIDNRTVDNFVSNLKKQLKLTSEKEYQIKTIRGVGYSLMNSV
ncbi:response regulator transcription factor [Aliikangiella coralliicola]|uniref:Response regulator transcription factor n=1 Tax=Aliikangiella coralliicola TaxID=2592383 RepID=A0A545UEZ3_9GAMM|nr:response regulator transcription factor [Aliikangiella coralliicola]TQV88028.1 response regulator transcription factor [Aliikangiella coralliicola]